jgi:glycosyltransferase involved in cell wall biosynthesis
VNVLFIHEIDWLAKVVFDIHTLAESLSLRGHQIYAIDYENTWRRASLRDTVNLRTKEIAAVSRAFPGSSVCLRRPGFIRIPGLSRLSAAFTHYFEIRKTIRGKSIDAIVLYSVPTNGLQAVHLARKFNIPVIFRSIDILNQLVTWPALRPVTRFLEKKVYSQADILLTLTPRLSRYVVHMGASDAKVKLLLMPVDTNIFHPSVDFTEVRRKWGLTDQNLVILFIGTLFDFSGLDILIRRFPEVLSERPEARLLIVGDGPQRSKLERIITDVGLQQKVIITGFQPYETMPQYINLATLCINTFLITNATRDIFPGKIVQYLACGKAVIATRLPGMVAVIPGEGQGVAYADNIDDMTGEIIALLGSTERRRQLEQAGLRYVTQVHSYDKISQELEATLEKAIKEKKNEAIFTGISV